MKQRLFSILLIAAALIVCSCASTDETSGGGDEYEERMQKFVEEISSYARKIKPGFIIIPQNGAELAFNNTDMGDGVRQTYIDAIDGIGIEELFYNGSPDIDNERLEILRELKSKKSSLTIMVSDFVSNDGYISDSINKNQTENFIAFPRSSDNYDYKYIPGTITGENTDNITKLADAKNYLYLISTEEFTNKDDMINQIKLTNYDVVLIDLFFESAALTSADINSLKKKANGKDRLVICYISIGSAENYRYYWQTGWKKGNPSWLKKYYEGYSDEFWVEYWEQEWQNIIYGYIDKIIAAGFDGVYLDNVEAYYFLTE